MAIKKRQFLNIRAYLVDIVLIAVTPLALGVAAAGDLPLLWVRAEAAERAGEGWEGREMWSVAEDGGAKDLEFLNIV